MAVLPEKADTQMPRRHYLLGGHSGRDLYGTPLHPTQQQEKMAAAACGTPDRRMKRDGLRVGIEFKRPNRPSSGDEVELDNFAAPTRAEHGHAPEVTVLADEINLSGAELLREVLHHDRSVWRRLSRKEPPKPEPQLLKQVHWHDPKPGISSGGSRSPRPTEASMRGGASPSRSCSICE